jgi:hypothetical protein
MEIAAIKTAVSRLWRDDTVEINCRELRILYRITRLPTSIADQLLDRMAEAIGLTYDELRVEAMERCWVGSYGEPWD